jgi:hypothetical protein
MTEVFSRGGERRVAESRVPNRQVADSNYIPAGCNTSVVTMATILSLAFTLLTLAVLATGK